jgi:hypothetical protein
MKFFDLNNNGKYDWWEYIIPILIILVIEIIAEIVARSLMS